MASQLHEQTCFACWLNTLGVDERVGPSLMAATFRAGWAAAAATILPAPLVPYFPARNMTVPQLADVEREVRAFMAMPPSPDVAKAMGGEH